MLNHITIMGRMTRDPELRYTSSQKPVASVTLAVERDFGDKQTDFIDCVAWGKTAEFMQKYFHKGSLAAISGRLQIREWTDQNGNKRRNAEVVAESLYFGESKGSKPTTTYGETQYPAPVNGMEYSPMTDADGELPF